MNFILALSDISISIDLRLYRVPKMGEVVSKWRLWFLEELLQVEFVNFVTGNPNFYSFFSSQA